MSAFNELWEAAQKRRVIFIDGGMILFNRRKRDEVLVIYAIVVAPERHKQGIGKCLLHEAVEFTKPVAVEAKCPSDLDSNGWYKHLGFKILRTEKSSKPGNPDVNVWRLEL